MTRLIVITGLRPVASVLRPVALHVLVDGAALLVVHGLADLPGDVLALLGVDLGAVLLGHALAFGLVLGPALLLGDGLALGGVAGLAVFYGDFVALFDLKVEVENWPKKKELAF